MIFGAPDLLNSHINTKAYKYNNGILNMNKIYTTDVLAEKIDISLVELLTGPKSALVFHANFSVNVKDLIKRGRVAYDLPALGLNLGETHPSMKCLDFPGPKGSIDCGKIPSYLIDPWHKILFSRKGSLMQNSDHTSNWFVYQGKQEEALKEFL